MFDPEEVLETMVYNTKLNDDMARLTLYCIVCPEHGGLVVKNVGEAIEAATGANVQSEALGSDCRYFPVAIGLDAELVKAIFAPPPEGS